MGKRVAVAGLLVVGALVAAAGQATAAGTFVDDDGNVHERAIEEVARHGITEGCGPESFCPSTVVSRGQMASLLARALVLPPATVDAFADDSGHPHEDGVNRLVAAGIASGRSGGTFGASDPVTRGAMATFLDRGFGYASGAVDRFTDDGGSVHEASVDDAAAAGIVLGCTATTFCPDDPVRRDQVATFLGRALGFVSPQYPPGMAPARPPYPPAPPPLVVMEDMGMPVPLDPPLMVCRHLPDGSWSGALRMRWSDGFDEIAYGGLPAAGSFEARGERGSWARFDVGQFPGGNGCWGSLTRYSSFWVPPGT